MSKESLMKEYEQLVQFQYESVSAKTRAYSVEKEIYCRQQVLTSLNHYVFSAFYSKGFQLLSMSNPLHIRFML